MVSPTVVQKPDVRHSRESAAMHVSGVALAKCTINIDGTVSDCTLMKSLPYMDQQILEGVRGMRFSPVMYQGHPQRVKMVIPIRVAAS
jgi:protein TonB